MGGLVTNANPQDLPEGASPRCFDVDFVTGSVFTRPGLGSVYTYASTLVITSYVAYNGIGTFGYIGKAPLVNETFILEGFTGSTSYLNGIEISVIAVNDADNTFTAAVPKEDDGPYSGLDARAISTVGNFLGPNAPNSASNQGTGNPWSSPDNILGDTGYASAVSDMSASVTIVPTTAVVPSGFHSGQPWVNPTRIFSTNPTQVAGSGSVSDPLLISGCNFNISNSATIQGLTVQISDGATSPFTTLTAQLATGQTGIGTAVSISVPPVINPLTPQVLGSSTYQWGTTLTPSLLNSSNFGVLLNVGGTGGATYYANSFSITVYYTTSGTSDELFAQTFNFAVPSTSGVTGLEYTFQAYSSAATTITIQPLKNGVAVGNPMSQVLTSTPTVYSLGGPGNLWGTTWLYSDANSVGFGVQIVASGSGTTYVNDLDVIVYVTPALSNFNYVKSYIQNDEQIYTLALDSSGFMWLEDVTNDPGVLSIALSGILPGSFAKSATEDDQEYILFSNLTIGTDRPRVFNGTQFLPLSQVGPGAPPNAGAAQGNGNAPLEILTWTLSGSPEIITFTYDPSTFTAIVGSIYVINDLLPASSAAAIALQGQSVVVLSGAAPGTFTADVPASAQGLSGSGTGGTLTLAAGYGISRIYQSAPSGLPPSHGAVSFNGQEALLSSGATSTAPGNIITYYYGSGGAAQDPTLLAAIATGLPVYVYLSANTPFLGGYTVQLLQNGNGVAVPPYQGGHGNIPYFQVHWPGAAAAQAYSTPEVPGIGVGAGNDGTFQVTMATIVLDVPAPLEEGDYITINGAVPSGWDNVWQIFQAVTSGILNITEEQVLTPGTVTYSFNWATVPIPTGGLQAGDTVAITGATGATYFNGTFVVGTVTGPDGGIFTITNSSATAVAGPFIEPVGVPAVGDVFGTNFIIDPGATAVNTTTPSIFNPPSYTPNSGTLAVAGSPFTGIGAGTRQVVVYFITESGYETACSPPLTFDLSGNALYVSITNIPCGPPNVVARGLAFTEAGQNGVPGANFYTIPNDVYQTVNGVQSLLANSTIIYDNVTTQVTLTFTDAVLLDSTAIDIQGNDLFNLIELGSSAWCVPYAQRMFYGLQLNKVQNFLNLPFDGGFLSNVTGAGQAPSYDTFIVGGPFSNLQPTAWTTQNVTDQGLIISPVTGDGLYIKNTYGVVTPSTQMVGLIYQTAYQDQDQVPIININTTYSVRVACNIPSGITTGTLVIDLTDYSGGSWGTTYGSFSVPFSSMNTTVQVFSGTLLTSTFPVFGSAFSGVSPNLQLRVYCLGMGVGADIIIDRLEVFPTAQPYLLAQVYGSYIDDLEAIDASGTGGIIDTSTENTQACMGGFVMRDEMYLLKTGSMYATQDDPNSEPGGWTLREVSNKVGTIGINSYDAGEEWFVTACRSGIYGFNGGQPVKIMQEIWNVWECINWNAGNTIVLRNDIVNKRILCAVPLPTGTDPVTGVATATVTWLPYAPYNPAPTSPNIILMLNYQGMSTFDELVSSPEVHTTMFGTLTAVDMKRKWTFWQIATPYMDFIAQQNGEDFPLYICNGIDSSKIYQLSNTLYSDDGVAINSLYTTYGFVNATKAATLPIFGFHAKRYTVFQTTMDGYQATPMVSAGNAMVRMLPNTINPKYPYTVPMGIPLVTPCYDDYFRPINVKGNRMFIEVSTDAVGSWFNLSKLLITGKADPWSTLPATGGGNVGITSTQIQ